MAKTITSGLPFVAAWPSQEIKYEPGTAAPANEGLAFFAEAMNAAYEQLRGELVRDQNPDYAANPILKSAGDLVRYRAKTQGRSELAGELVRIFLWTDRAHTGGAPSAIVEIKIGATTKTAEVNGGVATTGYELVDFGTMAFDGDDLALEDITVELKTLTDATCEVGQIFIGYDRARSVLLDSPGGGSTLGGYAQSGYMALDLLRYQDGRPMSTQKLREILRDLRYLRDRAHASITSTAWRSGATATMRGDFSVLDAQRPALALASHWEFYLPAGGDIKVTTDAGIEGTASRVGAGWASVDLAHDVEQLFVPRNETLRIAGVPITPGPGNTYEECESICAWWVTP